MNNQKEFEHVSELVNLAADLERFGKDAVKLTARMANQGIFTNALEDAFVNAVVASQLVGQLADALAKAREVSTQPVN